MLMLDDEGFRAHLHFIRHKNLTSAERIFAAPYYTAEDPTAVKVMLDPAAKLQSGTPLVTHTPILMDVSLTNACNLHCPFCYMDAQPMSSTTGTILAKADFEVLLGRMKKARVLQVALGGGEPTLHPHFPEILRRLREEADIVPNYTTNGSNLTPAVLAATKAYCGAAAVSYSEDREAQVADAVKTLVAEGIQTNVHVVMLRDRIPRLYDIAQQCANWGARSVVFLLFKPMGRGGGLADQVIGGNDVPALQSAILRLIELHAQRGLVLSFDACSAPLLRDFPFLAESIDGCNGARNSAYVDWTLAMKPCSFMQGVPGVSLWNQSIAIAWQTPLFREFRGRVLIPRDVGCAACTFFGSCWGGCPLDSTLTVCAQKGVMNPKTGS